MKLKVFLIFFLAFSFIGIISAFEFNGTVYDINGDALNGSIINITIRNGDFSVNTSVSAQTNSTGWFNLTIDESPTGQWMYEPVITWENSTTGAIEYVGQSLPAFDNRTLIEVAGTSFYLRPAGTINITAVNRTGSRVAFNYQIKDQKLGYPIAENFNFSNMVTEATIVVPRDRNYSIMIYPNESMPISFNWNNFSAQESYNITAKNYINLSNYNFTTKKLNYQFNISMDFVRVSGYLNYSGINSWEEFTVVPYILEPGNMVHAEYGDMPYNISGAMGGTDVYVPATGFYDITLPSTPAETSNILLFATAKNGSYYGGFRNISNLNQTLTGFNFTNMSSLVGSASNITMDDLSNPLGINISTSKKMFSLVNKSSGNPLGNVSGHIEVEVDYSSLGAIDFTWMTDISQGGSSNFSIPLLNNTGIKEMNIFVGGGDFAPRRVSYTSSELSSAQEINISSFNPGVIENSSFNQSNLYMNLVISNQTCDVPSPGQGCFVGGVNDQGLDEFNPMKSIIGGGKLSFIMGTSDIKVHYVNVDMLASGPPDALFESSSDESTSNGFESAFRFGSQGPTIYDYALVTMPYTEGNSSVLGINESQDVNVSIPLLYDESWNVIWNTSSAANGTNATLLAGNYSHYAERQDEWQYLLDGIVCHENGANATYINATNPCFINKTSNEIVLRIPHFSGTGPEISGAITTLTSSNDNSNTGSGSSSSSSSSNSQTTTSVPKSSHSWTQILPGTVAAMGSFKSGIGIKEIIIQVKNKTQNVKITVEKYDDKPAEVSVEKSGKVNQYLHIKTENLNDVLENATVEFKVNKSWASENNVSKDNIVVSKFNESEEVWKELETVYSSEDDTYFYYNVTLTSFSYFAISEKVKLEDNGVGNQTVNNTNGNTGNVTGDKGSGEESNLTWLWITIVVIIVFVLIWMGYRTYFSESE